MWWLTHVLTSLFVGFVSGLSVGLVGWWQHQRRASIATEQLASATVQMERMQMISMVVPVLQQEVFDLRDKLSEEQNARRAAENRLAEVKVSLLDPESIET